MYLSTKYCCPALLQISFIVTGRPLAFLNYLDIIRRLYGVFQEEIEKLYGQVNEQSKAKLQVGDSLRCQSLGSEEIDVEL